MTSFVILLIIVLFSSPWLIQVLCLYELQLVFCLCLFSFWPSGFSPVKLIHLFDKILSLVFLLRFFLHYFFYFFLTCVLLVYFWIFGQILDVTFCTPLPVAVAMTTVSLYIFPLAETPYLDFVFLLGFSSWEFMLILNVHLMFTANTD